MTNYLEHLNDDGETYYMPVAQTCEPVVNSFDLIQAMCNQIKELDMHPEIMHVHYSDYIWLMVRSKGKNMINRLKKRRCTQM